MGMGMTIAVSKDAAGSVESWLSKRLPGCKRVGFVHDEGRKVTHINPEIIFEHY
jgi:phosphoribosylaminoimidazole (AIR) synthetase